MTRLLYSLFCISRRQTEAIPDEEMDPIHPKFGTATLSHLHLREVPDYIFTYSNISCLNLSYNELESLPSNIKDLTSLKTLTCTHNQLTSLPEEIGDMVNLTWLDLTHNKIERVPSTIKNLVHLAGLGLSDCGLGEFPSSVCSLSNLSKLGLFNNAITSIPSSIGNLKSLVKLDLSNNLLVRLPDEFTDMISLTWVNLSRNLLNELPETFGRLVNLTELGLAYNSLKSIPNLSTLKKLTKLPMHCNEIKNIGHWIGNMVSLEKVDLSYNSLETLPLTIFQLPSLTYLNLKQNKLTTLGQHEICIHHFLPPVPVALSSCKGGTSGFDWVLGSLTQNMGRHLEFLDVSNNNIQVIPHEWTKNNYKEFRLRSNPLCMTGLALNKNKEVLSNPIIFPPISSLKAICVNFLFSRWYGTSDMSQSNSLPLPRSVHSLPSSLQASFRYSLRCHHCRTPYSTDTLLQIIGRALPVAPFENRNWNLGGIQLIEYEVIRMGGSNLRRTSLVRGYTVPSLVRFCSYHCLQAYKESKFVARVSALRSHRPRRFRLNRARDS